MAQHAKITRTLQYPRCIAKDANYNVSPVDSGNLITYNATEIGAFFLPAVSMTNAGLSYQFITLNTGPMHLVSPTNVILSSVSVNAGHGVKSVGTGANIGVAISALCDGTYWHVWGAPTAANVRGFTER